jgi:two-component system, OmpR family, sensor histidine kinase KdpD
MWHRRTGKAVKESRPNPDELLARITAEEEPPKRGALKIFLGYAAGVGKTYTMLEAAHQRQKEIDVVVAYIETHGRAETESLLKGLEVIPRMQLEYQGLTLSEMDLDAVLKRHPHLALVDELAHTNTPNSRHLKRYQDVEELLEAGIDVYTTLNVQHIESLRDVVAQITGVWMREILPDSLIDTATEIEIVDLPPEELLKRLKDGKVYVPDQIAQATAMFFRKGNLTALRELTMRVATKHVNQQKQSYMRAHAIPGPWLTSERLLLCLDPNPEESIIRRTHRLAQQLGAEWFAINVETPNRSLPSPDQQDRFTTALRLAERMGAKTATIQGNSVITAVTEFARLNNITKVILGNSPRKLWRNPFRSTIENDILRQSHPFDVYVMGETGEKTEVEKASEQIFHNWLDYLPGLGLAVLITVLGFLWPEVLSSAVVGILYFLGFLFTALFWGFGPSILVAVVSIFVFMFLFISPFQSLFKSEYLVFLPAFFVIGIIFSYLASRSRRQIAAVRYRERETAALYALSKDLTVSNDLESYAQAIIKRTKETFGLEVAIFLPDVQKKGLLKTYARSSDINIDEKEAAAALWSFQHQKIVGHSTDTLPYAKARYLPLVTARQTIGVIGLWSSDHDNQLTVDREKLLGAYIDLEALAIEGILMSEEAQNAKILRTTEALQTALLNSISHDLRTPLVSIYEALNSLREGWANLDEAARKSLDQATQEAGTLNHMITNLIDQSRIDAGAIRLALTPARIPDIISVALEQSRGITESRQVKTDFPANLPSITVDFGLIVQAMANILDNAFKYSPHNTMVEVSARQVGKDIEIAVADLGIGIPQQDLERIFDKFYRVHRPSSVEGTGLGISISKGFVEAHGGRIWAENRPGGGTIIKVVLPIAANTRQTVT